MKRITPSLLMILLLSCARVVAPSGGPEDTEGPRVTGVYPEPGACVAVPQEIIIEFSEKLSAEKSDVQIYPSAGEVVVGGREISIFPDTSTSVVVITVSGDISDRRGNAAGAPEVFVWNTSDARDYAVLQASVTRSGGGAVTGACRCDLFLLPDSSAPLTSVFPDSNDTILAGWLPPGSYLMHCYEDVDRSLRWDMEREPGALARLTLSAADTTLTGFEMSITDSIGPSVAGITVPDGWHLEIDWNEQVSESTSEEALITVEGPGGEQVEVLGYSAFAGRSTTGKTTVYTSRMSDTLYTVTVQGITDLAGNPSLPDTLEVWATDSLPSTGFAIRAGYPEDGAIDVPPGGPFTILFSDWVYLEHIEPLYSLTLVSDSSDVPGTLVRTSPAGFAFHPDNELLGERQYRIDVDSGLVSLQGDTLSGRTWTFKPAWSDSPGSVSGRITGTGAAAVTVVISPAGGGGDAVTAIFTPGDYTVTGLSGGRYTAACFVDWNGDSVWNPGEPYGAWPGVVEVFPGIETVDVDIQVVP